MKTLYPKMAIVSALALVVIVTSIGSHQIYAPRECPGCTEFKKLTTQFEKDVIDAESVQAPDPDRIQTLLGEYSDNVMELFRTPSTSP